MDELSPRDEAERRTAMIDRAARALFDWYLGRAGRTRLPEDFDRLGPATREQFEIGALRVLRAAGAIS